jgi:hypothetical protein
MHEPINNAWQLNAVFALCDTWLDEVHGPMDSKYPMIGFIQQDCTGKVTNSFKKISGMWRHRNWLFCGT